MRTCLFLFFIQITTGFLQKPYNHRTNTALHLSNSELPNKIIEAQYRELLQKESFGELLNEIDQGKNMSKEDRQEMWEQAHIATVKKLYIQGLWPVDVPIPTFTIEPQLSSLQGH